MLPSATNGPPEEEFTISVRLQCDTRPDDDTFRANLERYEQAGSSTSTSLPRGDIDAWLDGMHQLAGQVGLERSS
jgi:hypothetical protein